MGVKVDFEYDIDEVIVIKALGVCGIVSSLSIDDSGNKNYYVKTGVDGQWWPERHLERK